MELEKIISDITRNYDSIIKEMEMEGFEEIV